MGVCLISTAGVIIVTQRRELGFSDDHILVMYSPNMLPYVYEWKLCTSAVVPVTTAFIDKAHTKHRDGLHGIM